MNGESALTICNAIKGDSKMSKKNYKDIAKTIIDNVGGKDNVIECYHCMSRLRLRLKDVHKVQLDVIKNTGFTDAVLNGNQVQVIAGNEVYDLYDAVIELTGTEVGLGEVDEPVKEKLTLKNAFFAFFGGIANSVAPCIPVLIGAGVLQGVYLLLAEIGILSPESSTYQILAAACNAPFYFFPIFVGFNCAKQFGGNQLLGAFLGAVLVHPSFLGMVDSGNPITLLGLPVRAINYTSTVLPAFVSVYVMSQVEKWVAKHSPKSIRVVLEPFATTLIMLPLTLWVLAPLGDYVGIGINAIVTFIHDVTGPLAPAIIAALIPFLVLTGTHSIIGTLAVPMLIQTGIETVMMPGALIHNFNHGALSLAIALKTKKSELKSTGFSSSFTALVGGISEPSLFGFFAKYKSAMIALIAGQFVSGLWCGITGTGIHAFPAGGPAFTQIMAFLGGSTGNFVNAVIATAAGMIVTFVIAYILYKDEKA